MARDKEDINSLYAISLMIRKKSIGKGERREIAEVTLDIYR